MTLAPGCSTARLPGMRGAHGRGLSASSNDRPLAAGAAYAPREGWAVAGSISGETE
jgi:hypothetical protein